MIPEKEKENKTMAKAIWFDMDGTIADLYGVEGWLPMLRAYDAKPYEMAKPLVRMASLARVLNRLQKEGYQIGIVSWLSKTSTKEYDEAVATAKREWLKKHLASVKFDAIDILAYGTPKHEGRNGILFDDEMKNRIEWKGEAHDEKNIIEKLKAL